MYLLLQCAPSAETVTTKKAMTDSNGGATTEATAAAVLASSCTMAPTSSKKRKASSSSASDTAAAPASSASPAKRLTTAGQKVGGGAGGGHHQSASAVAAAAKESREKLHADLNYTPLSLQDIRDRLQLMCYKVPTVPESKFAVGAGTEEEGGGSGAAAAAAAAATAAVPDASPGSNDGAGENKLAPPLDISALKKWAMSMQAVIEELSILMGCVYPATYVWGTDRSGAADQNLSLLNSELARSQDYIATLVTPRLTDVLTPAMSLVTKTTVTTKDETTGAEIKVNHFETTPEDPNYVQFGTVVLARNAAMLRHVVLANIDKMLQAIKDYLTAQQKDAQHDSRGFVY
jgi:hypothetical protein